MKRGSLRTQLIGWNIVALAILLCVLGVVIRYTIISSLKLSVERTLEKRMQSFRKPPMRGGGRGTRPGLPPMGHGQFGIPPGQPFRREDGPRFGDGSLYGGGAMRGPFGEIRPEMPRFLPDSASEPRHFDLSGQALGPRQMLSTESFAAAIRTGRSDSRRVVINGEPHQVLSLPLRERGRVTGVGQIAYGLTEIDLAVSSLDTALLVLMPVGLLCAAGGGIFLTNRVLSRVRRTTHAAESIISGEGKEAFAARLPVSGNDEFSELSATFNGLLGRLETAFRQQTRVLEQQRRFTADASHELKTPLTVIKGTASMALGGDASFTEAQYRTALTQINQASTTMAKLVQDLLILARSDSEQMGQNRIDLLVGEIFAHALQNVPHPAHTVVLDVADPHLTVRGNEGELTRLVTNLLDNAVRYTPPGGTITLSAHEENSDTVLRVADTGIGIAPEHLAHIGERFYRVDAARARADGGTGLGLSICRSIAAAHNGTLEIASTPGIGTVVTVRVKPPTTP
ncbi:MAG: HAMP domain-containing protein [Fibrella sp.]|nr:HAMP domain-containing protein [Armatimonadota bacterium]